MFEYDYNGSKFNKFEFCFPVAVIKSEDEKV